MAIQSVKVLINGQQHTLTYNSESGKYEGTITAPTITSYNVNSGHYYPVSVVATSAAGVAVEVNDKDPTLGDYCKLKAVEKQPPVLTFTYPTSDSRIVNNTPTIAWDVNEEVNGSGVNPDTISLVINAGAAITAGITKTKTQNGYSCTYVPAALSDGNNTLKIAASDFDGNAATPKTINFVIDTVAPSLTLTSPEDNLVTGNKSCTVSGSTNDATSSPVTIKISHNGADQGVIAVDGPGAFSRVLTLVSGVNTIVVTATDGAGKTTSITRTVTLDTTPPRITAVAITPNPVDCGATFIIAVAVSDQ